MLISRIATLRIIAAVILASLCRCATAPLTAAHPDTARRPAAISYETAPLRTIDGNLSVHLQFARATAEGIQVRLFVTNISPHPISLETAGVSARAGDVPLLRIDTGKESLRLDPGRGHRLWLDFAAPAGKDPRDVAQIAITLCCVLGAGQAVPSGEVVLESYGEESLELHLSKSLTL